MSSLETVDMSVAELTVDQRVYVVDARREPVFDYQAYSIGAGL